MHLYMPGPSLHCSICVEEEMPGMWLVLVTSCAHSSLTLTSSDKPLLPPSEFSTMQKPVVLPCKKLKAAFSSFLISLGLAGPTGDNDSARESVEAACSVYLGERGVQIADVSLFPPFSLWKLSRRRDLFEWFSKSILRSALIQWGPGNGMISASLHSCQTMLDAYLPLNSGTPGACTPALQPPGPTQAPRNGHCGQCQREKSVLYTDRSRQLQESESWFW